MSFRNNSENSYPAIEVHVTRGNFTESVHLVDAVLVDERGKTVANFGLGGGAMTYPRSAIKMLQAVSFIESGAYEALNLSEKHLAISCASHNGEGFHTELVMDWLERANFSENDLICGPHYPYDESTSRDLIRHGDLPGRRHNNCSGKHSGMLCAMKSLGLNTKNYGAYEHPWQVRLRNILSELSGEDLHRAPWGIDGCSIPTYAMSLQAMARGLGQLLLTGDLVDERKESLRQIRQAVLRNPYYVGGTGDFCSDLMALGQDRMILKSGAEGVFAGVLLQQGLSFSLKVRDGNARAARVATGAILRQLGGIAEDEFVKLSSHTQPTVKNWEGTTVGKIFVPHTLLS